MCTALGVLSLLKIRPAGRGLIRATASWGHAILIERSLFAGCCMQTWGIRDGCASRDVDKDVVKRVKQGSASVAVVRAAEDEEGDNRPLGSEPEVPGHPSSNQAEFER